MIDELMRNSALIGRGTIAKRGGQLIGRLAQQPNERVILQVEQRVAAVGTLIEMRLDRRGLVDLEFAEPERDELVFIRMYKLAG
jgi:hypothetical protein